MLVEYTLRQKNLVTEGCRVYYKSHSLNTSSPANGHSFWRLSNKRSQLASGHSFWCGWRVAWQIGSVCRVLSVGYLKSGQKISNMTCGFESVLFAFPLLYFPQSFNTSLIYDALNISKVRVEMSFLSKRVAFWNLPSTNTCHHTYYSFHLSVVFAYEGVHFGEAVRIACVYVSSALCWSWFCAKNLLLSVGKVSFSGTIQIWLSIVGKAESVVVWHYPYALLASNYEEICSSLVFIAKLLFWWVPSDSLSLLCWSKSTTTKCK